MMPASTRLLACWICLLAAVICLVFLPVSSDRDVFLLLAFILMTWLSVWLICRNHHTPDWTFIEGELLPDAQYRLPVVFLCGEISDNRSISMLPEACLIPVSNISDLMYAVRQLLIVRPDWGKQIAVCYCISPQQIHDHSAAEQSVFALRWQIIQLRRMTSLAVPLLISAGVATDKADSVYPLRKLFFAGGLRQVWQENTAPVCTTKWLQAEGAQALQHQVLLNALESWLLQNVLKVLSDKHADASAVRPYAVVLSLLPGVPGPTSLWNDWINQKTALCLTPVIPAASLLPHKNLLVLLPTGQGITPFIRLIRAMLFTFFIALTIAFCLVAWNNRSLIRQVTFDLRRYEFIPATNSDLKASAVRKLQDDALMLDDYARHGVPLKFGLGLYQGNHLHIPVLRAIATWLPAPQATKRSELPSSPVRLDSLNLFEAGEFRLKSGSQKILIQALVGIKAKPGWLIVISGHTDATGTPEGNRRLSLKRAEAVRAWMRDTGGVPDSCFAVHGYGSGRPVASNSSVEGRAANRRVEISLVPQANACQVPGGLNRSSQDDDQS